MDTVLVLHFMMAIASMLGAIPTPTIVILPKDPVGILTPKTLNCLIYNPRATSGKKLKQFIHISCPQTYKNGSIVA